MVASIPCQPTRKTFFEVSRYGHLGACRTLHGRNPSLTDLSISTESTHHLTTPHLSALCGIAPHKGWPVMALPKFWYTLHGYVATSRKPVKAGAGGKRTDGARTAELFACLGLNNKLKHRNVVPSQYQPFVKHLHYTTSQSFFYLVKAKNRDYCPRFLHNFFPILIPPGGYSAPPKTKPKNNPKILLASGLGFRPSSTSFSSSWQSMYCSL